MSKIKLEPNASGSGTLTIAAPNTNSDRTLTLNDTTGTILDTGNTTFFAADQWYLNADHTGDATITAWAQGSSTTGGGSIGTGLTAFRVSNE